MTKYTRIVVFETKSGDRYVTSPLYLPIGPGKVDTDVCDVSWSTLRIIYEGARTYLDFVKANVEVFSHIKAAYTDGVLNPPVIYRLKKNEPLPPAHVYVYLHEKNEKVTAKSVVADIKAAMETRAKLNAIVSDIQNTLRIEEKLDLDCALDFANACYMLGWKVDGDKLYNEKGTLVSEKRFDIEIPGTKEKLLAFVQKCNPSQSGGMWSDPGYILDFVLDERAGTVVIVFLED